MEINRNVLWRKMLKDRKTRYNQTDTIACFACARQQTCQIHGNKGKKIKRTGNELDKFSQDSVIMVFRRMIENRGRTERSGSTDGSSSDRLTHFDILFKALIHLKVWPCCS